MKNKKKILFSSVMVIALCLSLIAGSTFALFTSESKVNIAVTSGTVKVTAGLKVDAVYSAEANETIQETDDGYAGEATAYGVTSKYEWTNPGIASSTVNEITTYTFKNTGTAKVDESGALQLERVTPGDKVALTLSITNDSNVTAKYRVKLSAPESSYALASAMRTYVAETTPSASVEIDNKEAVANYTSAWKDLPVGESPEYKITVDLPVEKGNAYQNLAVTYTVTVEAVQGNAAVSGDKTINYIEATTETLSSEDINASGELTTSKTLETVLPAAENNSDKVTVTVPAEVKLTENASTLSLYIAETDETPTLTVLDNDETVAIAYDIKVEGVASDNQTPITITIPYSSATSAPSKIIHIKDNGQPETIENFTYADGKITFMTTSFSTFAVATVDPSAIIISAEEKQYGYADFAQALATAQNGETVKLMKDLTLNASNTGAIEISKSIIFDGNGKTLTVSGNYKANTFGLYINSSENISATVENLNIKATGVERAIRFNGNAGGTVKNVKITCDGVGIHVKGTGDVDIDGVNVIATPVDNEKYSAHKRSGVVVGSAVTVTMTNSNITAINGEKTDDTRFWGKAVYVGYGAKGTLILQSRNTINGDFGLAIDGSENSSILNYIIVKDDNNVNGAIGSPSGGSYKHIEIMGGTFDNDPTTYLAEGYTIDIVNNTYVVKSGYTEIDPFNDPEIPYNVQVLWDGNQLTFKAISKEDNSILGSKVISKNDFPNYNEGEGSPGIDFDLEYTILISIEEYQTEGDYILKGEYFFFDEWIVLHKDGTVSKVSE
ncbi:MAG: right-handed parallel beta-helix repeat-containing protein [Clostridia bacterium]|nr:right-handed parallel beta-helix repeat-containing protein [Clostridia bacterium]